MQAAVSALFKSVFYSRDFDVLPKPHPSVSCQAVFALWLRSLHAPVVCGPARRPVLCIGPTRLAIFLKDPRAVVKRRTLDPGPALLWRPCCYRSCHFILRCWENHLSWCTLDEALKHRFLCAFCDFSTSHLTHPFAQIPGCGRRLWSCDCTSRRQSQARCCLYVVLLSSRDITRIGTV